METKTRYHLNNVYFEDPLRFGEIFLVQIGRRYCEPTEEIHPHTHRNWLELTVVTGGAATILSNGEECVVHSGDLHLSFAGDVHEIRADCGEHLDYDFLSFFLDEGELNEALKTVMQTCRGGKSRVFRDGRISNLVECAITEFMVKDQPYSEEVLSDLFHLIAVYLVRAFAETKENPRNVSEAEILCFRLTNYIDTHIFFLERLEEIGPKFNYSYRYLSRLFKKTTGKTLSEYYRHRSLETAKSLVLERKKKIGEIAEMFGYSLYSFSKAFKEKYGVSPKSMQKGKNQ